MIDGQYAVEVDTPLGRKSGMVGLTVQGGKAIVDIDAPVLGKQTITGAVEGNSFEADGMVKVFPFGKIAYTAAGTVTGDDLSATIHTSKGDFTAVGVRIA